MDRMKFLDKERSKSDIQALANALTNRKRNKINITPINPNINGSNSNDNILGGATELLSGGLKAYNTLKDSNLFGGSNASEIGTIGNAAKNFIGGNTTDYGTIGNAANSFIGGGSDFGSIGNAANSFIGGDGLGSIGSSGDGLGSIGSSGGGTPWGAIAGFAKNGYNLISDKTPSEYSDLEQGLIYPLQGAAQGSAFGPWGALGGALYGLGYSFKDDIGLDDDNFLGKLIFPIGMGDGGGFIDLG